MQNHKAMYISYYNWFDTRMKKSGDLLERKGYEVSYYLSKFNHVTKQADKNILNNNVYLLNVPKYYKNVSIRRIFSKKIKRILKKEKPDIVYCILPPNSLAKSLIGHKHNYKVIFDIIDLWPESMPNKRYDRTILFRKWKQLRDDYISKADYIITECALFEEKLNKGINRSKIQTIHLSREKSTFSENHCLDMDRIHLCYLGSINNIIDFDEIVRVIEGLKRYKPVVLHIIGKGEKSDEFIQHAERAGASVFFYGVIYDISEKQKIFQQCHYGLNIYKESTCIGVTIKSIDYFENGLPIINSIGADTENIVSTFKCGYNVKDIDFEEAANVYDIEIRKRSREVFEHFFIDEIFLTKMNTIFSNMGVEEKKENAL